MPRTSEGFEVQTATLPNGDQALVVHKGVILTVREGPRIVDIEGDRLVPDPRVAPAPGPAPKLH